MPPNQTKIKRSDRSMKKRSSGRRPSSFHNLKSDSDWLPQAASTPFSRTSLPVSIAPKNCVIIPVEPSLPTSFRSCNHGCGVAHGQPWNNNVRHFRFESILCPRTLSSWWCGTTVHPLDRSVRSPLEWSRPVWADRSLIYMILHHPDHSCSPAGVLYHKALLAQHLMTTKMRSG